MTRLSLLLWLVGLGLVGQQPVMTVVGHADGYLGIHLFDAGDIDGDGVGDLVAASPLDSCPAPQLGFCGSDAGSIRAFSGRDGHQIWVVPGMGSRQLASEVDQIQDANGDGIKDYALCDSPITGPFPPPIVTLNFGVVSGVDGHWLHQNVDNQLGNSYVNYRIDGMGGMGDVNADGRGDYGLSRFTIEYPSAGSYVFHSHFDLFDGLTGNMIRRHTALTDESYSSHDSMGLGDITGDGFGDYLAFQYVGSTNAMRGTIYSGIDGSVLRSFPMPAMNYVRAIDLGSDIDGLGFGDIVIGLSRTSCPSAQFCGRVLCVSSETGQVLWSHIGAPFTALGLNVATIGDEDQDGRRDVLCVVQSPVGVEIRSGATGTVIATLPAVGAEDVCSLADITGDAVADYAVSQFTETVFPIYGRIQFFASRPMPTPEVAAWASGCGVLAALQLAADAPLIGSIAAVEVSGVPTGLTVGIYASWLPAAPLPLGGGCILGLDPASIACLGQFASPVSGQVALNFPIPVVPVSAGLELALQSAVWPTASPLGFDISNSLRVRVGY